MAVAKANPFRLLSQSPWFRDQIAAAQRRIQLLRAVQSGAVQLRKIEVTSYVVREHRVNAHVRYIGPPRGKVATKGRR